MKRALALFFTVALLSISLGLFAASAFAEPSPVGGSNGVCNNNPGGLGNNGLHGGIVNHCVAI
jgi:hypothetical protein